MSRLRFALFGTNYGASYLEPLLASRRATLVAIGARGSRRSRELAGLLEVPLYTSPVDLLADARPDAAIVAVTDGDALILQLLKAGTHVLAEHPVTPATVATATRLAQQRGLVFAVNAHFWDLPAPRRFIALCRAAGRPRAVVADVHARALYSALDILARATGLDTFDRVKAVVGPGMGDSWWPAAAIVASAKGVPVSIQLPASDRRRDDGSDHLVGHRIGVAFARETVTLVDTHGPVVQGGKASSRVWRLAFAPAPVVTVARVAAARTASNARALAHFIRAIDGTIRATDLRADLRRTAAVATAWSALRRATRPTK